MKKIISSFLLFSFFVTNIVKADEAVNIPAVETPAGEVDPGEAISPMKLNQKAPFSGVMLSPKALASIVTKLKSFDARVELASDEAKTTAEEVCRNEKTNQKIKNDADVEILRARIADNERNLKLYENHVKNIQDSQSDPALLIGLGVVGGAVFTILTVFAVAQSTK